MEDESNANSDIQYDNMALAQRHPDEIDNLRVVLQDIGQIMNTLRANNERRISPEQNIIEISNATPEPIILGNLHQHDEEVGELVIIPLVAPEVGAVETVETNAVLEVNSNNRPAEFEHLIYLDTQPQNDVIVISDSGDAVSPPAVDTSTPSTKKRKRASSKELTPKHNLTKENDEDDGSTCPICMDTWEMTGNHRLVSLKCGHLFGHSCIRRWLQESPAGAKCCPSCKARTVQRDIRFIYAKKVCVVDKSEEYRLQTLVDQEKSKVVKLNFDIGVLKIELDIHKSLVQRLEGELSNIKANAITTDTSSSLCSSLPRPKMYKMYMDRNIELSKEPGCRVMICGQVNPSLIVSVKSTLSLFPGYGVRFIDLPTFRQLHFLHMSTKQVRDLNFDINEEHLISASMDKSVKLFHIHNRAVVNVFSPSDKTLWAASFDCQRTNSIYLGAQHGSTYVYDIRSANNFLEECKTDGDLSPVINICSVLRSDDIPFGGFLVCKLQSVWFYQYLITAELVPTKLNVDGPFVSMTYDKSTNYILISTRPNSKIVTSRYIIAKLKQIDQSIVLQIVSIFYGSTLQPVMSRSTQINIDDNVIVAAYLQDTKLLTTWGINNNSKMQSISISDTVFDTCPIYINNQVYLSALTDSRCRIYTVKSEKTF